MVGYYITSIDTGRGLVDHIQENNRGGRMNLREVLIESVQNKCSGSLNVKVDRFIKAVENEDSVSAFSVATLENSAIGISYNLFHRDPYGMERYRLWDMKSVIGKQAGEVMELFLSDDPLEKTAGLAVINALSQDYIRKNPGEYQIDFESDIIDLIKPDKLTIVGLVGYFSPMIGSIMKLVGEVIVLEKDESLLKGSYPFTMTNDPSELGRCDKVLMTATTVLNDSLAGLLPFCTNADLLVVMGPSAGFLPDALFDTGVHVVGGTYIDDPELFIERFESGIKWGDSTRKVWFRAKVPGR